MAGKEGRWSTNSQEWPLVDSCLGFLLLFLFFPGLQGGSETFCRDLLLCSTGTIEASFKPHESLIRETELLSSGSVRGFFFLIEI